MVVRLWKAAIMRDIKQNQMHHMYQNILGQKTVNLTQHSFVDSVLKVKSPLTADDGISSVDPSGVTSFPWQQESSTSLWCNETRIKRLITVSRRTRQYPIHQPNMAGKTRKQTTLAENIIQWNSFDDLVGLSTLYLLWSKHVQARVNRYMSVSQALDIIYV